MRPVLLLTALSFCWPMQLTAQPVGQAEGSSPEPARTVVIESADGHQLEVGPISGARALCALRLPADSADSLHQQKHPRLGIGGFPKQTVVAWPDPEEPAEDGGDFMEVARRSAGVAPLVGISETEVRFACWVGLPGQSSPTRGVLRQIMDGEELLVSYVRGDDSTGEVTFPLAGVRERIASTFGIPESPTETDYLQDDLLRARVQYRSSTCYLLNHEKKREDCLEAVNLCRQRSPRSIVDLVGCIELQ